MIKVKNAPRKVYLQIEDNLPNNVDFKELHEVTWCSERINKSDLVYFQRKRKRKTRSSRSVTWAKTYAQQELEILAKQQPDSPLLYFSQEIIALCDRFGKSGQSGSSAPFVVRLIAEALEKLMLFRPLTPITPKTFTVDVVGESIKDESQLDQLSEYYEKE